MESLNIDWSKNLLQMIKKFQLDKQNDQIFNSLINFCFYV